MHIIYQGYVLTERFPKFGCEGISQREFVCDADAESLSQCDILHHHTIIDFNEVDMRIYLPEKVIIHRGR